MRLLEIETHELVVIDVTNVNEMNEMVRIYKKIERLVKLSVSLLLVSDGDDAGAQLLLLFSYSPYVVGCNYCIKYDKETPADPECPQQIDSFLTMATSW